MLRLLVPHYELKDGVITPDGTKPPKEIYEEGQLWPARGKPGKERVWPRILTQFMQVNPQDDSSVLAFANQYGILGCWLWDPFDRREPFPDGELGELANRALGVIREQRLRQLLRQPSLEISPQLPEAVKACLKEPRLFTWSLWNPEPLDTWRAACSDFWSVFFALRSVGVYLHQQHGPGRLQKWADGRGREPLDTVTAALRSLAGKRASPELQEWVQSSWGQDFPPEERFRAALGVVQAAGRNTWASANLTLRPADNLLGFQWEPDPPCLLNLLYLLMLSVFVTFPPTQCAFPTCVAFSRGDSRWCSDEHAALHRQQKSRVAKRFSFTDEHADEMERLATTQCIPFEEAAEQVKASHSTSIRPIGTKSARAGTSRSSRQSTRPRKTTSGSRKHRSPRST